MSNLPAIPDQPLPTTQPRVIYAYPLTGPPPASIGDAGRVMQRAMDILTRFGDEVQQLAAEMTPYPCAACPPDRPTNMAGWPEWQCRQHFARHALKDRARVVGWLKAVTG